MGQGQGYVKLYRSLMDSQIWEVLNPGQKVVMVTLLMLVCWQETNYNYYGMDIKVQPGQFICSQKQLEEACGKGITRQTVRSALSKLKTYNFITITQPFSNHSTTIIQPLPNHYPTKGKKLITIVNWGKFQGTEESPTKEPTTTPTQVKHELNMTQTKVTTEPTIIKKETTTKNKELRIKKNKTSSAQIDESLREFCGENEDLMAALKGWVEMRKKIKKPLTARAVNLNLKKLHKLSNGNEQIMIGIVNQSTMNSWQGFFPLKAEESKQERLARMFEETNRREEMRNDRQPEDTNWSYVPF